MEVAADILIWHFGMASGEESAQNMEILSDEEKARAGRFHFPQDAARYAYFHRVLRQLLASALPEAPAPKSLKFSLGLHRKPCLTDFPNLHFNLSHSKGSATLAISRGGSIGVDLEIVDPGFPAHQVAGQYFQPEEIARMEMAPSELECSIRFYQLWTAKEAVMKLCGLGMHLPPLEIGVDLSSQPPSVKCAALESPCTLFTVSMERTTGIEILSLAHFQPGAKIRVIHGDTPLASPSLLL